MKKAKKTLFSLAIASIAVIMAFQVSAIYAKPQSNPGIFEPNVSVVAVASKAEAAVAVTVAAPPASVKVLPVTATAEIKTQAIETAVIPAPPVKAVSSPLVNAAIQTEPNKAKNILPGILLDEEKNILYGPNGKGLLLSGFDYDMNQKFFFASLDPWQRAFGYNSLYDTLAPVSSIYFRTRTVTFNYNGLDWMVKLWKGQYGITCGAEVGLYTKSPSEKFQYDCASKENFLLMDLQVLKGGVTYFTREAQMHWWQTGFVMGGVVVLNDLTVKSTITFKDQVMTDAFVNALNSQENAKGIKYVVNGLSVSVSW